MQTSILSKFRYSEKAIIFCGLLRVYELYNSPEFNLAIFLYTANIYRDYREFTGISCTLYRVFPVTGKNL